jgi:hypothetical protein
MSDLERKIVESVLDELVTYENVRKLDPMGFFGMVAERLDCVCIDEENLLYLYINREGEIEDDVLNKIIKLCYKYGYEDRVRKCWKKSKV